MLLVLVDGDDDIVIVADRFIGDLRRIGVEHAVLEQLFDLCLDVIHIHVTYDNQRLVVGPVPLVVVVAQFFILKVIDYAHQSDGHTSAVF